MTGHVNDYELVKHPLTPPSAASPSRGTPPVAWQSQFHGSPLAWPAPRPLGLTNAALISHDP